MGPQQALEVLPHLDALLHVGGPQPGEEHEKAGCPPLQPRGAVLDPGQDRQHSRDLTKCQAEPAEHRGSCWGHALGVERSGWVGTGGLVPEKIAALLRLSHTDVT